MEAQVRFIMKCQLKIQEVMIVWGVGGRRMAMHP
jgi:hypothetical protein